MDHVDQFFQKSHYNINRIFLSIPGVWPFHTKIRRYATYFTMILILGPGFTFQMLGIMEILQNTFELVDSLPLLLLAVVVNYKMIYMVHTLRKVKLLLIMIQHYCLSSKSNEEYKIQNSHALYARNLGYVYAGIVLSHSVLFNLATLLTRLMSTELKKDMLSNKTLDVQIGISYRVNYIVDFDTYYVPIFIHTTICNVTYVFLGVMLDVLYISLVEHCTGMFAAIRYRLENPFLLENNSDDLMKIFMKEKYYSNVVYSIRRHTEAIQFINTINAVFSTPLFIHIGCTILVLSFLGYQVITNTESASRFLKHVSYLDALLLNVFFENWVGQKMIDSSEKVFEAAYNTEWYNMPIAARKLLVMVMMKSNKPMILTASKFIILSYVTFNAVIRTSSSYFMLLRSVA